VADNTPITPGSGVDIASDDVGGVQFQRVKIDMGGDGASLPAFGDATYGLGVDVKRVGGNVTVVQGTGSNLKVDASGYAVPVTDNGGSLTVDAASLPLPTGAATEATLAGIRTGTDKIPAAPAAEHVTAASPHAARLSDGSAFYDATKTGQLPTALTGSGNLKVAIVEASATVPVSDGSGSLTVDAPVGTPVFVRISNGSAAVDALPVTDNGGNLSIDDGGNSITVDGTVTANQGTPAVASNAWPVKVSDGTSSVGITDVGGAKCLKVDVVQQTVPTSNLFYVSGVAVAVAASAETASGVQRVAIVDEAGTYFKEANPLPVRSTYPEHTRLKKSIALSASQTDIAIITPTSGKRFVLLNVTITIITSGALAVFDNSNSDTNMIYQGTPPVGAIIPLHFEPGLPSEAINSVLRYTSGSGLTGHLVLFGYEV